MAQQRLLKKYDSVEIFDGLPFPLYAVSKPAFSEQERDFAEKLEKIISKNASLSLLQNNALIKSDSFFSELKNNVLPMVNISGATQRMIDIKSFDELKKALEKALSFTKTEHAEKLAVFVAKKSTGYGKLYSLMGDDLLEEVMVNSADESVFVFHREFGMCKTNIFLEGEELLLLIQKIAKSVGREFSEKQPLLDARLPDGNRANATFDYVSPRGHTLTIRKFTKAPLSIIDLIEKHTISLEVAAWLWLFVEGLNAEPKNIIITGGSSTGKTSLLNVLAGFIPLNSRIVSIEDTLELDLRKRQNWVQLESRPEMLGLPETTMDDLLKNALRMRPDRIIVGEVRGKEAQTLFTAMDTGHSGILGTLHSNSARECLLRLKTEPMNVPESMLSLLDIIIVMQKTMEKRTGAVRRVKHIAEVSRMEEKTLLSNIFEYDQRDSILKRTDVPSHAFEDLAEKTGTTKNDLRREILVRQKILEWIMGQRIRDGERVQEIVNLYYSSPKTVLENITRDLE